MARLGKMRVSTGRWLMLLCSISSSLEADRPYNDKTNLLRCFLSSSLQHLRGGADGTQHDTEELDLDNLVEKRWPLSELAPSLRTADDEVVNITIKGFAALLDPIVCEDVTAQGNENRFLDDDEAFGILIHESKGRRYKGVAKDRKELYDGEYKEYIYEADKDSVSLGDLAPEPMEEFLGKEEAADLWKNDSLWRNLITAESQQAAGTGIVSEFYEEPTEFTEESVSETLKLRDGGVKMMIQKETHKLLMELRNNQSKETAPEKVREPQVDKSNPFLELFQEREPQEKEEKHKDSVRALLEETVPPSSEKVQATIRSFNKVIKRERRTFLEHRLSIEMDEQTDVDDEMDYLNRHLLFAARAGLTNNVTIAIQNGADIHAVDERFDNWTCLHFAADKGHEQTVEMLLYYGSRVDDRDIKFNITALHLAVLQCRPKVCELLLAAGADPDAESIQGVSPLMIAEENEWISSKHHEVLELLSRAKRVAQRKREREQAKDPEPLQFRSSKKTRLVMAEDDD